MLFTLCLTRVKVFDPVFNMVLAERLELPTYGLQNHCYYQLSYASVVFKSCLLRLQLFRQHDVSNLDQMFQKYSMIHSTLDVLPESF